MRTLKIERYGDQIRLVKIKANSFKCAEKERKKADTLEEIEQRFDNNLARAKGRIIELGFCNDWEYFVTLTINGEKRNRYSLPQYIKELGYWIGNYNKKFSCKLKYILVPEQHKDGAFHMHGLFAGVAPDSLVKNEYNFLDCPYYAKSFGFISLSPIRDKDKTVSYITKYVTKAVGQTSLKKGEHLFYSSRGLAGKETVYELPVPDDFKLDFENEYCGISWRKPRDVEKMIFDIIASGEQPQKEN